MRHRRAGILVLLAVLGLLALGWVTRTVPFAESPLASSHPRASSRSVAPSRSVVASQDVATRAMALEKAPLTERWIEVQIDRPTGERPWEGADCLERAAYHESTLPEEMVLRARAMVTPGHADEEILALNAQILDIWVRNDEAALPGVYERLVALTTWCASPCSDAKVLGRTLVEKFSGSTTPPDRLVDVNVQLLMGSEPPALWPLALDLVARHRPAALIDLVDHPDEALRAEVAMRVACDDALLRTVDAETLARVQATVPDHPESLALPIASAWLALGDSDAASSTVEGMRDYLERPAARPECDPSQPPDMELPDGGTLVSFPRAKRCSDDLEAAYALLEALPEDRAVGFDPVELGFRRAFTRCEGLGCGLVVGKWKGSWTWVESRQRALFASPELRACVEAVAEGLDVRALGSSTLNFYLSARACP